MEAVRLTGNKGQSWVVDFDIKGAFDHIAHESIMQALARRVSDRRMLALIRSWLRCGVMEDGQFRSTTAGTPQGGVISPLLANLVFHNLDQALGKLRHAATFIRYADDGLVLTWSERQARQALEIVESAITADGMQLNTEKTRIARLEEGIDFLGFHVRRQPSRLNRNKTYTYRWPSRKAEHAARTRIREIMADPSVRWMSLPDLLNEKVNPILRGWGSYFRYGNSAAQFDRMDRYVHRRAIIFENRKHQRWGRNRVRGLTYDRLLRMGLHALRGTILPGAPDARRA